MELSLDSNVVFVPKTISEFLSQLSAVKDGADRSSKLAEYRKRLEDEMRKIEVFKRELPLCMVILKDGEFDFVFFWCQIFFLGSFFVDVLCVCV